MYLYTTLWRNLQDASQRHKSSQNKGKDMLYYCICDSISCQWLSLPACILEIQVSIPNVRTRQLKFLNKLANKHWNDLRKEHTSCLSLEIFYLTLSKNNTKTSMSKQTEWASKAWKNIWELTVEHPLKKCQIINTTDNADWGVMGKINIKNLTLKNWTLCRETNLKISQHRSIQGSKDLLKICKFRIAVAAAAWWHGVERAMWGEYMQYTFLLVCVQCTCGGICVYLYMYAYGGQRVILSDWAMIS